ncbi:hypothetical protein BofuT4_P057030.1 [Botrytis cinerea T4]|uniref:Uncharacterized protein n=1 Tax=Botryotinia fuckeliana (strain T4) TaxID=999810 RepID=G2XUF3_BOTF4|nr:hypothetical protein BofuT4_P057030.1 [Botrytis cinerea T4]
MYGACTKLACLQKDDDDNTQMQVQRIRTTFVPSFQAQTSFAFAFAFALSCSTHWLVVSLAGRASAVYIVWRKYNVSPRRSARSALHYFMPWKHEAFNYSTNLSIFDSLTALVTCFPRPHNPSSPKPAPFCSAVSGDDRFLIVTKDGNFSPSPNFSPGTPQRERFYGAVGFGLAFYGTPTVRPTSTSTNASWSRPTPTPMQLRIVGICSRWHLTANVDDYEGIDVEEVLDIVIIDPSAVDKLSSQLANQLIQFQGCYDYCYEHSNREHFDKHETYCGLQTFVSKAIDGASGWLDVLNSGRILHHDDDLAGSMSTAKKRWIFSGMHPNNPDKIPEYICLQAGDIPSRNARLNFNIDSITGYTTSLAIAKASVRWNIIQIPVSDLQSGLHLRL